MKSKMPKLMNGRIHVGLVESVTSEDIEDERRVGLLEVSDHAVLRWMEREWRIDIKGVREEIAEAIGEDTVAALSGCGSYRAGGFIVRDGVVVTYVPKEGCKNVK